MRQSHKPVIFLRKAGEYTVEKRLGQGRYGICYLAKDSQNRPVVLKYFRQNTRKHYWDYVQWEAVVLSGLSHPSVPEFLGVINEGRRYFFVLEYMPGDSLKSLLFQKHRNFSSEEIFQIGNQLLEVLLYVHSRSVVHGDMSISNVLYDGRQISLLDFGLSAYTGLRGLERDLDYACFGNLLLYLLYSGYRGEKRGAWYEELPLTEGQKDFLKRLLGLKNRFTDTETVRKEFIRNFSLKQ